ncbi:hypothetical protein [Actinoplanes sp. NPDC026623]|uniref:hypothetical protein n=1 Tax=Actinoplanes sp. NPDC026623 TaxID=3155610 RepID=UPI0033F9E71F
MIGDLYAMPLPSGYGACQVTGDGVVCLLDWHGDELPGVADLAAAGPMLPSHHAHDGTWPCCVRVTGPAPHQLIPVGNGPVAGGRPTATDSYSGWEHLGCQLALQRRWDHLLPAEVKDAYRRLEPARPVAVDFGAGPATIPGGTNPLDLTGAGPVRVPENGPVSWQALDALMSTAVVWAGPDRGFSAALAERPLIGEAFWRLPPAEVDLAATALTDVHLGPGVRRLRLPPTTMTCVFADGAGPESVDVLDDGHWISLCLGGAAPVIPAGLGRVSEVRIETGGTVSVSGLGALPSLRSLTVKWRGGPGRLDGAEALTGVRRLHLIGGYGLTAGTLAHLSALRHVEIDGIARPVARELKAMFGARVTIRGAKNENWLRANLNNPFRDWADGHEIGGAQACRAYAAALRGVARDPAGALRGLVEALNRIDARYQMIDTMYREEAAEAFLDLAERAGVPGDEAGRWFDEWRDF